MEGIGARTVSVSAVELEEDERFEGSPPTAKNVFNAFSKFQFLCLRNCRLMELSAPVNDMKFPIFSDCASEPPFAKTGHHARGVNESTKTDSKEKW